MDNHSFFRLGGGRVAPFADHAPLPPHDGAVLVAELTVHEGPHGPRRLVVCRRDTDVAVRRPDGRLLWLETDDLSAARDPDDPACVLVTHGDAESPMLLPPDYGTEGLAIASLESFCDSFDVEGWPEVAGPADPVAVPGLGEAPRETTLVRCALESYGACELHLDDRTGLVLGVRAGAALAADGATPPARGSLLLEVSVLREERSLASAAWFEPGDL
ncbi:hypothetical protein [Nocardioides sp. zg-DK7169]|uniref:hypothetical protein n=1 Tax=Nocardioides sp. zg-DK7169 TaxID=2736600 RepID=UPI001553595E|nr:hypothetical protein [Nocardioides sp. zg-DK7169]NPC97237.1 hypothetical protein [Nocardioides sp. zg-DK7169]